MNIACVYIDFTQGMNYHNLQGFILNFSVGVEKMICMELRSLGGVEYAPPGNLGNLCTLTLDTAESRAYADPGYAIAHARIACWISEQRESILGRFEKCSKLRKTTGNEEKGNKRQRRKGNKILWPTRGSYV